MSDRKLCKDCRHLLYEVECAKSPKPFDYVNGGNMGFYSAQAERESALGCGHEARWFEPREGK